MSSICCATLRHAIPCQAIYFAACQAAHLLLLLEEGLPREGRDGVGASLVLRRGRVGSGRPELPALARDPAFPGLPTSPLPILLFFINRASSFLNLHFPLEVSMCRCIFATQAAEIQQHIVATDAAGVGGGGGEGGGEGKRNSQLKAVAGVGEVQMWGSEGSQLHTVKVH